MMKGRCLECLYTKSSGFEPHAKKLALLNMVKQSANIWEDVQCVYAIFFFRCTGQNSIIGNKNDFEALQGKAKMKLEAGKAVMNNLKQKAILHLTGIKKALNISSKTKKTILPPTAQFAENN